MADERAEVVAEAIYLRVVETWQDQWPDWQHADEEQAAWCREAAGDVLAALDGAPAPQVQAARASGEEA